MYGTNPKNWLAVWVFALLLIQCAIGMRSRNRPVCPWKPQKNSADIHDYIAISAGWSHSLALKSDGSIVGWGDNRWGMADPPDGNDFVAIAAGTYYSLALKSDGSILGWGSGVHGEKYPPDGNDFVAIAAGSSHCLALKSDGSIVGWGDNDWGQARPPPGNNFVAIAAGFSHGLALKTNGSIVGWGSNDSGQARPPTGNDFVAIAAGYSHSLALNSDGSIVGWGEKLAMEKPTLPKPETKEKKKEPKVKVTDVVEVKNVSSLKFIKPPPKTIRLTVDDKMNIDLIHIKPGSFIMGRDVGWGEKFFARISSMFMVGKYPDEGPSRKVKITKGFYIGKYKVTSAQFCKFLSTVDNPQDYVKLNMFAHIEMKDGAYISKPGCENCAINVVHWKGAEAFCEWLSHQTGLTVRLPTEAEWEFAAHGPEGRLYPWGDEREENVKYYEDQASEYKTYPHPWSCAPVDAFPENVTPNGVVGMVGNIGEWCSDFYGRYLKNDVIDPQGPREEDLSDKSLNPLGEKYRVFRGRLSFAGPREFGDTVDGSGIYSFRIVVEQP